MLHYKYTNTEVDVIPGKDLVVVYLFPSLACLGEQTIFSILSQVNQLLHKNNKTKTILIQT